MKYCFSLFLLMFFITQSNAQYIDYYNLVNEANRYRYNQDYDKALQLFQEAFTKVDYVHAKNHAKAAMSAAKLNKAELVKLYLSEAFKAGYSQQFVNTKPFKKFRKSSQYHELMDEMAAFKNQSSASFNKEYKRKIDSLHYIDQKLLRGSSNVTEFDLDPTISYSDSANFSCLLTLIDQHGFPSEQAIGYYGYRKSWVIIHHSTRLVKHHDYHATLLGYLKTGEYLPENYCWVVDQGQELLNQPLIYHHWDVVKNITELTETEMDAIDKKRKEVGLASVRRIEVIKKSNPPRNRVKW